MRFNSFLARGAATLLAAAAMTPAAAFNHEDTVAPLAKGRFEVACSNVDQDVSRVVAGATAADYWEGNVVDGRARYITEILKYPGSAIVVNALVPDLRSIYPGNAGDIVRFATIVCHPTPKNNPDPGYALPGTGEIVPHMQPPGSAPKLISYVDVSAALGIQFSPIPPPGPTKLPMIVYSHGLTGSPISKGYISVMVELASQGYVVAAVFHGDARFSRIRLEDFNDYWYAFTQFDRIAEMMLLRPVSLKAMTDTVLTSAYAPGIDPDRIGGFGASLGGQAMIHLLGAKMSTSVGLACKDTVVDPRIKVAVGYVPYSGQSFLPAFCDNQGGADRVSKPFLAITGSADTTGPQKLTEQAVNRFQGTRYLVSLKDGQHELRPEDADDLVTWMVTFYNAYLDSRLGDPGAMSRFIRMNRVTGGRDESMIIDVHVPTTFDSAVSQAPVREFYNTVLDHYFLAAWQGEVDIILAGGAGVGWQLTGQSFKGYRQVPPANLGYASAQVCRFYGATVGGPNSHFFTAQPDACEVVKRMGGWFYEGVGFNVTPLSADGRCPAGYLQVNRAYNNRAAKNDSNHRYTTSDSTLREMGRLGWIVEGTAWCSAP